MNWAGLGDTLLKLGLPTLGGLLAGPGGAAVGKVIADTIGVPATPDAIGKAISGDPEVLKKIQDTEAEWARTTAAIAQASASQSDSINQTIRAEQGTISWYHWRHLLGYVTGLWAVGIAAATTRLLWTLDPVQIAAAVTLLTAMWTFFTALCALNGYVAMDNTRRTSAAAAGTGVPNVVDLIGGLFKRK